MRRVIRRPFASRQAPRRLNRRILVAMLAVALMPLAGLTALVGADLTAVNQTSIDEAHKTIVADAEQRERSAAIDGASTLAARLDSMAGELGQLASSLDPLLRSGTPAPLPVAQVAGHAQLVQTGTEPVMTLVGSQAALLGDGQHVADSLGANRGAVAAALDALHKHHPELSSVWLYNTSSTQLTAAPPVDRAALDTLLDNDRIDPARLLDRQLQAAVRGADAGTGPVPDEGSVPRRHTVYPAWTDVSAGVFRADVSTTVWTPLSATPGLFLGAELSQPAIADLVNHPVSSLADSYAMLLSPTGRWLSAGAGAAFDFHLGGSFEGTPLRGSVISAQSLIGGTPLTVQATLGGVKKVMFSAPVDSAARWTLVSVVPAKELAPGVASLGDGIRSGVRNILLLQVLPLAVALAAIAAFLAALFSRRLVGPVRALTLSAERLAQGHMDEPVPRQGTDEVGLLSEALENMRREISSSRQAILAAARELEQRVTDRTAELRVRNEELVALNALAGALTRSLDPAVLIGDAVETVRAVLPVQAAAGYAVIDGAARLMTVDPEGPGQVASQLAGGATTAIGSGDVTLVATNGGQVVALPCGAGGQVLGALVALVPADTPLPDRIRALLGAVAHQVGLALRTAQLSAEGRELAVLEERTRLAREIHDTLAQQLIGIVLQLEAAEALQTRNRPERSHDILVAARDQARLALQEARRSVWNLRPMPLEATGLAGAVSLEASRFSARTGCAVRVRSESTPWDLALSPQSEVALFRILQEALTNAERHSHARHVDVELRVQHGELVLRVIDQGSGFDVNSVEMDASGGFGLVGMRERARLIGARLEVVSQPNRGTTVTVAVPLEHQPATATA